MPSPKKTKSFLPEGYKVNSGGNEFFKLQPGENRIRIVSDPVVGKEGWKDNKPFRRGGIDARIDADEVDVDPKTKKPKINDYMAMYVYDHESGTVSIASFTQVGIKKAIQQFAEDPEWGHPSEYDLKIVKTGEGLATKYNVTTSPKKALPTSAQRVVDAAEENFDLDAALSIDAE